MSNSLRYFSLASSATTASPVAGANNFYRLGDVLPLGFAFTLIPEGDPIPDAPAGTVAPAGGAFVINRDFLPPASTGDLISAFAHASTTGPTLVTIAEGDNAASAPIPFDNDGVLKGLSSTGTGAYSVDNPGYYDINAILNAADVPSGVDVSVTVETSNDGGVTYIPVPQGSFIIYGCPRIETLTKNIFTGELAVGDLIHILASVRTSSTDPLSPTDPGPARPVGSAATDFEFNIAADSVFEAKYLGTAP